MKPIIISVWRFWLVVLVGGFCIIFVGASKQAQIDELEAQMAKLGCLPSIMEIQERLNEIEPNNPIPVDGKVSDDWRNSKTQTKWDRLTFNQYALVYFDPNHYAKGDVK